MTKDIVGRLRDFVDNTEPEGSAFFLNHEEAAALIESLSPPDGVGLTLETTAEEIDQLRRWSKDEGEGIPWIRDTLVTLLRDHERARALFSGQQDTATETQE